MIPGRNQEEFSFRSNAMTTNAGTNNLWGSETKGADSAAKPKLRVGLIGCGAISSVHLDGWQRLNPECRIVACADPIEERRNQSGEQAGVPPEHRFSCLNVLLQAGVRLD